MVQYIKQFGNNMNFYGGVEEDNMIKLVKKNSKKTQRRIGCYAPQLATRLYECKIIELGYECLKKQMGMKVKKIQDSVQVMLTFVDNIVSFFRKRLRWYFYHHMQME